MRFQLILILILISQVLKSQQKVESGGYIIPVYNYQQIEPLFHPDESNDTTYIFNFWATYCSPCIKELPYFQQIGKEFENRNLKIVLISLDFKSQIKTKLTSFIKSKKIQLPVVVLSDPDANSWIDKVDSSWSGAIPATLIVKGKDREFYEKSFEYDELKLLTIKFLEK